jgi:hypothetical protein
MTSWAGLPRIALGAVLVAMLAIWVDASGTLSSWNTATVANTTDTARTPVLALTHQYPDHASGSTTTCAAVATTTFLTSQACDGTPLPATATPASPSQTDTIINTGTLTPAQVTATTGLSACGPRQLTNAKVATNPMLARNGTAFNATSGPSILTGSGSVTFSGATNDYASTVATVAPPAQTAVLGAGAIGVWFQAPTTTTAGGLFSFDTVAQVPSAPTTKNTLALYMTGGHLGFRRGPGATDTVGTPTAATYNDGKWHFAYITFNAVLTLTSISLYIDANPAAVLQTPGLGAAIAVPASGYWILGWSQLDNFFSGSESDFTVFGSASSNGAALYNSGSQANYVTTANGLLVNAQLLWPLSDDGTVPFTGPYPIFGGAANPCGAITESWNGSTAQTLTATLTTPINTTIPAAGVSAPYAVVLSVPSAYASTLVTGLQMYAPATYTVTAGSWSIAFSWAHASSAPTFIITTS